MLVCLLYMARKSKKKDAVGFLRGLGSSLPQETKKGIAAVLFFLLGALLTLAALGSAGVVGEDLYGFFSSLLGIGYFLLPILSFILGTVLLRDEEHSLPLIKGIASVFFFVARSSL